MTSTGTGSERSCPTCSAPRPEAAQCCPYCGDVFAQARPPGAGSAIANVPRGPVPAAAAAPVLVSAGRGMLLALLGYYTLRLVTAPLAANYPGEIFLHLVNLPFHEAGHVLFSPFGRFLQVAGGTVMQLLVPAAVAISFYRRRDLFATTIAGWWFGESLTDVAPYAADARAGELPLLGGVTGSEVADYHDWEVLLERLGLLAWDQTIGRLFLVAGGLVMAAALAGGAFVAFRGLRGRVTRESARDR